MQHTFHTLIKQIRKTRNLSSREFARAIEASPQYLSQINLGDRAVSAELIHRIHDKLHLSKQEMADLLLIQQQTSGEIRFFTKEIKERDKKALADYAAEILCSQTEQSVKGDQYD